MLLQNIIDTVLGKWLGAGKAPLPYGQTEPTPRPDGKIVFEANPTPTPTPNPFNTPTPVPQVPQVLGSSTSKTDSQGRRLAVEDYQGLSKTPIPLPNQEIQDLIWEMFPNEATPAAVVLAGEDASFNPYGMNEHNNNGSIDYGLFQNNDFTMNEMLNKAKYGNQMRSAGVNQPTDVLGDISKGAKVANITRQYETDGGASPWSWWYGWQNKGYTIDPNKTPQDLARMKYKSGQRPYFKTAQYLDRNNIDY